MPEPDRPASGLMMARCETSVTRPAMFLGLPRKLSSLLILLALLGITAVDDWTMYVAVAVIVGMVWAAVREQVSNDWWGFDNWCASVTVDTRSLDSGGSDGWGGAKLCALPLNAIPLGIDRGATG